MVKVVHLGFKTSTSFTSVRLTNTRTVSFFNPKGAGWLLLPKEGRTLKGSRHG